MLIDIAFIRQIIFKIPIGFWNALFRSDIDLPFFQHENYEKKNIFQITFDQRKNLFIELFRVKVGFSSYSSKTGEWPKRGPK